MTEMPETAPLGATEWLQAHLDAPDVAVLDATLYLPNEGKDARAEFAAAHIPGARFFDINEIADPDTDLPHMIPSAGRFSRLVGALGIGNDTLCVFYDQRGIFSAARGWWLMGLFGHDRAVVLNGGLPAWRREGRALEAGEAGGASRKRNSGRISARPACAASATCWPTSAAARTWCSTRAPPAGSTRPCRNPGRACAAATFRARAACRSRSC